MTVEEGFSTVTVGVDHAPTFNFAMDQAGVPFIHEVRIHNAGAPLPRGRIELEFAPDLGPVRILEVPALGEGEEHGEGVVDLQLPPERLRQVGEAERGQLRARYVVDGVLQGRYDGNVEVLAHNEWPGLRAPPPLLACFATPNHPVVITLLRRVADRLRDETGDPSLSGYQLRSPERVTATIEALVRVLQCLGLSYLGVAASFEDCGQKVRLPDVVLREGLGNCLDLSLLVVACLEAMGLAPLVVLVKGHAFPGVWLVDERFPEGVVGDTARLRNAVLLGQLVFFDASAMVASPSPSWAALREVAGRHLSDEAAFVYAIDVRVARTERFRPLPYRSEPASDAVDAEDAVSRSILEEASRVPSVLPAARPPAGPPDPVAARFRRWRESLLDLSLRNKLLNFRTDVKTSVPLDVPEIARFEDKIAGDATFEIHPRPLIDALRDDDLVERRDVAGLRRERLVGDLERLILHTQLDEVETLRRAVALDRDARTSMQESGANSLFLALGLLKWFESEGSSQARFAPLVLIPVELLYDRSLRRIRLRRLADDPLPNPTLVEKMRRDFSVDLSQAGELAADDSGVDVPAILRAVRTAIARMPRWEVLEEAHLGLFSFAKFLMWRDLEANEAALMGNPFIRHMVTGEGRPFPNAVARTEPSSLDSAVPVGSLPLVLDADSTQTAAVVSALGGRSFVLQGPPGTGKSQTIANLIAVAVAKGRTVLFVSEKMAALEVVHRRLSQAGLGDFCLELHSHKANKKDVIASLVRPMERVRTRASRAWETATTENADQRSRLNAYAAALHGPHPLGMTFFQACGRWMALDRAPELRITLPEGAALDAGRFAVMREAWEALAASARGVEPVSGQVWRACAVQGWSASGERRLGDQLRRVLTAADALEAAAATLTRALNLDGEVSPKGLGLVADLGQALGQGPFADVDPGVMGPWLKEADAWLLAARDTAKKRGDLALRWTDKVFDLDPTWLQRFRQWAPAFFLFAWVMLWGARRQLATYARGALRSNLQVLDDLTTARALHESAPALRSGEEALRAALPGWGGDIDELGALAHRTAAVHRAFLALPGFEASEVRGWADPASDGRRESLRAAALGAQEALTEWSAARRDLEEALVCTLPGERVATRGVAAQFIAALPTFRAWALYRQASGAATGAGLGPVVSAHAAGEITADQVPAGAERAVLAAWIEAVRDGSAVLRDFDGGNHHRLVEKFRSLDRSLVAELGPSAIVAILDQKVPAFDDNVSASSEAGILRRESRKKTRHIPVRKLLQEIKNLLPTIKPCLLMSPLSVAQYLPADGRRFDLVVFDEASQICTHDAIGALARGEQVVVVGDSKQLPPTSFFQRAAEEGPVDDNEVVELESILDEAVAAGLPGQSLGWHYRSRHQALIAFSNDNFYEGHLNVFPAARGRVTDLGVHLHPVPTGFYERGSSRTNRAEAVALVEHLVASLRLYGPGERTFGVVTFSQAQQTLISDLLDLERSGDPSLERHFTGDEGVFVKNLENVQGDERDEILLSVGYGPDENGRVAMNFGPLNRAGGERRLNVAVTRARLQFRVFSTMTADQIDLSRTQAKGARLLKAFLRYAASQSAPSRTGSQGDFDSDFERQVFDVLVSRGWEVDSQVGCGAYRIDLAVVHPQKPGVYALAVECDGAPYHSAATARDRDRLRQQVLEGLGWRVHRVWSTDWWFARDQEITRLEEAIDRALAEGPPGPQPVAAPVVAVPAMEAEAPAREASPGASPYVVASLQRLSADPESLHAFQHLDALVAACEAVVAVEAPILLDELARRVLPAFGATTLTERARRRVQDAVRRSRKVRMEGEVCWRPKDDPASWSTFRTGVREIDQIPVEELAAATEWVLVRNVALPRKALAKEAARMVGVERLGARVAARMDLAIDLLMRRGRARQEGDQVTRIA